MTIFWKIITFPVRFVLFLIIGLVAGAITLIDNTVGMVLLYASAFISALSPVLYLLWIFASVVVISSSVKAAGAFILKDNWENLVVIVGGFLLIFLLQYSQKIAEHIYIALATAANFVWRFAKMIIKCDVCELVC